MRDSQKRDWYNTSYVSVTFKHVSVRHRQGSVVVLLANPALDYHSCRPTPDTLLVSVPISGQLKSHLPELLLLLADVQVWGPDQRDAGQPPVRHECGQGPLPRHRRPRALPAAGHRRRGPTTTPYDDGSTRRLDRPPLTPNVLLPCCWRWCRAVTRTRGTSTSRCRSAGAAAAAPTSRQTRSPPSS